jgi:serine/threonine protein kinase
VKQVAKTVLDALNILHRSGFVHTGTSFNHIHLRYQTNPITDIKPSNVLVNMKEDSDHYEDGIGTAVFRSPEAQLEMNWNRSTDIWSFGAMVSGRVFIYSIY